MTNRILAALAILALATFAAMAHVSDTVTLRLLKGAMETAQAAQTETQELVGR